VHVATSSVENLLRVARQDVVADVAFAAFLGDGPPPQVVSIPAAGSPEGLSREELEGLVREVSADPELTHADVLVRSVRIGRALSLAVAPLRDHVVGPSMIGVVAEAGRRFEPGQLDVLERLGRRLARHLEAMQRLDEPPASGAEPPACPDDRPHDRPERRGPEAPGSAPEGGGAAPSGLSGGVPRALWWTERDPVTGLPGLGRFFSRAARMLGPEPRAPGATGALALVVVEVPDVSTTPVVARALRSQLRSSDVLARIDSNLLAAAVAILPAAGGEGVEQRLASAANAALGGQGAVRAVHLMAEPADCRHVDELLEEAVSSLGGLRSGSGGAPWRGAGGSAARLPIP
jgi:hypothetical protein